jgi:hypothetical protein
MAELRELERKIMSAEMAVALGEFRIDARDSGPLFSQWFSAVRLFESGGSMQTIQENQGFFKYVSNPLEPVVLNYAVYRYLCHVS